MYGKIFNKYVKYVNNKCHGRGRIELGRERDAPPPPRIPLSLRVLFLPLPWHLLFTYFTYFIEYFVNTFYICFYIFFHFGPLKGPLFRVEVEAKQMLKLALE